jgi:hypothetical protein
MHRLSTQTLRPSWQVPCVKATKKHKTTQKVCLSSHWVTERQCKSQTPHKPADIHMCAAYNCTRSPPLPWLRPHHSDSLGPPTTAQYAPTMHPSPPDKDPPSNIFNPTHTPTHPSATTSIHHNHTGFRLPPRNTQSVPPRPALMPPSTVSEHRLVVLMVLVWGVLLLVLLLTVSLHSNIQPTVSAHRHAIHSSHSTRSRVRVCIVDETNAPADASLRCQHAHAHHATKGRKLLIQPQAVSLQGEIGSATPGNSRRTRGPVTHNGKESSARAIGCQQCAAAVEPLPSNTSACSL